MAKALWIELSKSSQADLPKNPHFKATKSFSPKGSSYPQLLLAVESTMNGYGLQTMMKLSAAPEDGWLNLGFDGYPSELFPQVQQLFADAVSKR